ncbi:MAG: SPOR domain-containing protein [Balneolaceae bacterium]
MMIQWKMMWMTTFFLLAAMGVQQAVAQERIPREYTSSDQMVSMDRTTPFSDALEVFNEFSTRFEDQPLVDRTGFGGNIGITLPPMHWKEALQMILRVQRMVLYEDEYYSELLTLDQARQRSSGGDEDASEPVASGEDVMTTRTREVRINATFFEGSRRALREIGVDWSTLTSLTPDNAGDFVGEDGNEQLPSNFDNRFVSINARGAQNVSQSVFSSLVNFGDVGAGIEVQALFSGFEADNLGKVLATPSVKVIDGQEGRIQVGEDFSIKQRDFAGNVTDQFFSTGTILTVTPQIVEYRDTSFIYLDMSVERSSAQPDPVSTVISKEQADTHALLLDGESTVIAGLYRTDQSEVRRGIPILKDLPPWFFGLRYLFGFNSTDVSESELIVLVQAELEESIPIRMAQAMRSSRTLLEGQQQRHRDGLDYVPNPVDVTLPEAGEMESSVPAIPSESDVPVSQVSTTPEPRAQRPTTEPLNSLNRSAEFNRNALPPSVREEELENVDPDQPVSNYYVIGGSFQNRSNAEHFYQQLDGRGYAAELLQQAGNGFYRVAFQGFSTLEEAVIYMQRIRESEEPDAWAVQSTSSP